MLARLPAGYDVKASQTPSGHPVGAGGRTGATRSVGKSIPPGRKATPESALLPEHASRNPEGFPGAYNQMSLEIKTLSTTRCARPSGSC